MLLWLINHSSLWMINFSAFYFATFQNGNANLIHNLRKGVFLKTFIEKRSSLNFILFQIWVKMVKVQNLAQFLTILALMTCTAYLVTFDFGGKLSEPRVKVARRCLYADSNVTKAESERVRELRECSSVKFTSSEKELTSESQMLIHSEENSGCHLTVGLRESDIQIDFGAGILNASSLGIGELLPIPDLDDSQANPVFPLEKASLNATFVKIWTCEKGALMTSLISVIKSGSIPVVIDCDLDLPYNWALDWKNALILVDELKFEVTQLKIVI